MRLDQTCDITVGTRDAIHVPFVVGKLAPQEHTDLTPGDFVKFIDDKFTYFKLALKEDAHGILNPFLDKISTYDAVVVLLFPGITSPVRHYFDIDPTIKEMHQALLEEELEIAKKADPDCAGCYRIRNNTVIRD